MDRDYFDRNNRNALSYKRLCPLECIKVEAKKWRKNL